MRTMYESSCRFQSEFGTMARICGVDRSKSGTSSRFAPAWTKKVTAVLAFSWTARMSFRSTSARPPRVTLHAAAAATMLAGPRPGRTRSARSRNVCALSGGFVFGTAAALRSLATRFITTCGKISSLQPSPRRSRTMTSSVSAGFSSPGASAFPRGSTQGATARRRPSPRFVARRRERRRRPRTRDVFYPSRGSPRLHQRFSPTGRARRVVVPVAVVIARRDRARDAPPMPPYPRPSRAGASTRRPSREGGTSAIAPSH